MNPNDYTSAFGNVSDPSDSFLKGFQGGFAINQLQAEQQQQQQAALAQQQQQQVIQALVNNPNASADDYAKAMVMVPGLSKPLEQAWSTKNTTQQQAELSDLAQWGAALQQQRPDLVAKAMNDKADAIENTNRGAPTPESQALRQHARDVLDNPDFAAVMIKAKLAANPSGKGLIDNIVALNKDARDQNESDAKVAGDKADTAAKNATLVGQTLGSLQGKGATPAQAYTAIGFLKGRGALSDAEAQSLRDSVPTDDPKALDTWFGQQRGAGMKPDDQQKYLTPDANTVANNATSIRTTSMNNATQIKVQQMIQDAKDDENAFTKSLKKLYPEGSPEYQEALRQWVNKQAGINAAGGGGRSVVYNGRIIASGNEVAQALRNITELPVESNAGFMGMGQPKSTSLLSAGMAGLKNALNSDQVKTYNTMWTGVSRNLGTLETSGLATTGDLTRSIDKLAFVPGDTGYNALRKLAEVRQITEAALDPKLADPAVPPDQKKYIQGVIDAVHQAVPYTHSDLTRFERMQKANPQMTFQQFAAQTVNKGQPQAAPGAGKVVNFGDLK